MDERRSDQNFQVVLPEEKEIRENLGNLQFILLTGEAGDGKSRLIRTLLPELESHGFKISSLVQITHADNVRNVCFGKI